MSSVLDSAFPRDIWGHVVTLINEPIPIKQTVTSFEEFFHASFQWPLGVDVLEREAELLDRTWSQFTYEDFQRFPLFTVLTSKVVHYTKCEGKPS